MTASQNQQNIVGHLRSTLAKMEIALGAINEAVAWTDDHGKIHWCNGPFDELVDQKHLLNLGSLITDLIPLSRDGSPLSDDEHPVMKTLSEEESVDDVFEYHSNQERGVLHLEVSTRRMRWDGKTWAVFSARDVTHRIKSEAELVKARVEAESANRAKSSFLANVSHELRTPLNAIIGYSEILNEDAEARGLNEFVPDLNKIRVSGKHLLQLINEVLEMSKMESGKMELLVEKFHLDELVNEVASIVQPLVKKNNNKLEIVKSYDEGSEMCSDQSKIRQIMLNLLGNAAKFTKQGKITLIIEERKQTAVQKVLFHIQDTGIGMSPAQMEKVFHPFSQGDQKTTREFGGTGLGLAIVKSFVEMIQGTIQSESKEGRGTKFMVTLPRIIRTDAKAEEGLPSSTSKETEEAGRSLEDEHSV